MQVSGWGQCTELTHSTVTRKEGSNGMSAAYGSELQFAYEESIAACELILVCNIWLKQRQCIKVIFICMI